MPRFVVLEHDWPRLHWDLMLEHDGILRTWRLAAPPEANATIDAEASFDHRLIYLDYEGPVSGNRGTVRRWDAGTYRVEEEMAERLCLWFEGQRLRGRAILERGQFRRSRSAVVENEPGGSGARSGDGSQEQPPDEPLPAP